MAIHGRLSVVATVVTTPTVDAGENPLAGGEGPAADGGTPAVDGGSPAADAASPIVRSQLVDQNGTPFQLKGASSMWLAWESLPFAESKNALKYMRDHWNLSVIRASMGTEQSGGYLTDPVGMNSKVEAVIQNAIELGVYVLVDWHTEVAAAADPQVNQQTAAVAFFTEMATKYGAYPNVIWEPYNEPAGPTWPQIKAYHQAVVDAVRAAGSDNLMVLGTPQWSQRVDQAAADPVVGTNLLYTLHWYSCTHGQSFRSLGDKAIAGGIALFVTEFGATFSDGGLAQNHNYVCADEANLWFAWMSQNNISGVAWKLDQCADASCILGGNASLDGPWPSNTLSSDVAGASYPGTLPVSGTAIQGGHGQFVVNWMGQ